MTTENARYAMLEVRAFLQRFVQEPLHTDRGFCGKKTRCTAPNIEVTQLQNTFINYRCISCGGTDFNTWD